MSKTNNFFSFIFFLYLSSTFYGYALKKNILYFNYLNEFIIILIGIFFFFKIKEIDFSFLFKNYALSLFALYILINFLFKNSYTLADFLRLKYYLMNIFFLYMIFSKKKILRQINFNKIFISLFFISLIFGFINLLAGDIFLNFFYENPQNMNISYHNKNIRLVSLFNSPIIFGFIMNYALSIVLLRKDLKLFIRIFLIFSILLMIMFTFSRLSYLACFLIFVFFLYFNKKYFYFFFILFSVLILFFFVDEIYKITYSSLSPLRFGNYFISILKRLDDLQNLSSYSNYLDQISYNENLYSDNSFLKIFFGHKFSLFGWGHDKIFYEISLVSLFYELGLSGVFLVIIILINLFINIKSRLGEKGIILFIPLIVYFIFNNSIISNTLNLITYITFLKIYPVYNDPSN